MVKTTNSGGTGTIPGQGTTIPRVLWCGRKVNKIWKKIFKHLLYHIQNLLIYICLFLNPWFCFQSLVHMLIVTPAFQKTQFHKLSTQIR